MQRYNFFSYKEQKKVKKNKKIFKVLIIREIIFIFFIIPPFKNKNVSLQIMFTLYINRRIIKFWNKNVKSV